MLEFFISGQDIDLHEMNLWISNEIGQAYESFIKNLQGMETKNCILSSF
jgi:hypothetical protein